MNNQRREFIKISAAAALMLIAATGCDPEKVIDDVTGKQDDDDAFGAEVSEFVDPDARAVVVLFNQAVDPASVSNATIAVRDKSGHLAGNYVVSADAQDPEGRRVLIALDPGVTLRAGWKYRIEIAASVKSRDGKTLQQATTLSFATRARSPFESAPGGAPVRSKIVVISDVHMGRQKGIDGHYALFGQHAASLTDFLKEVRRSDTVRELVIAGDLMDLWVVPMQERTYDGTVSDAADFYRSVASAPTNRPVVEVLNAIANDGTIKVVYVPGNHDMTMTETVFRSIFPNVHWAGTQPGTGVYYPHAPDETIVFEHGHDYDLFNAPDPLTRTGSLLPPGYFVSRIYASGNQARFAKKAGTKSRGGDDEAAFKSAWDLAVSSIAFDGFDPAAKTIVTGVEGYTQTLSPDEARDMYAPAIMQNWEARQRRNGVYDPQSPYLGRLNGSGYFMPFGSLSASAATQYFAPGRSRIAVFGHTHRAMVEKTTWTDACVYANAGTWVDDRFLDEGTQNRTCVVVDSAHWSGSEIHDVSVYRYLGGTQLHRIGEDVIDAAAT